MVGCPKCITLEEQRNMAIKALIAYANGTFGNGLARATLTQMKERDGRTN